MGKSSSKEEVGPPPLLEHPWRRGVVFEKLFEEKLKEDIRKITLETKKILGETKKVKILLLGPGQHGKSSLINSISSVDEGGIVCPRLAMARVKPVTKKLYHQAIGGNFILMDVHGVSSGPDVNYARYAENLAKGHLRPGYQFSGDVPACEDQHKYYIPNPDLSQEAHCIVFVAAADTLMKGTMTTEIYKQMDSVKNTMMDLDERFVLVLTKIDEACDLVRDDITDVFHSRKIDTVVKKAHQQFGIPISNIFSAEKLRA